MSTVEGERKINKWHYDVKTEVRGSFTYMPYDIKYDKIITNYYNELLLQAFDVRSRGRKENKELVL